uniref:Putative secreted peptide n=1 Tax=Anopheles braziliensis TaxID=58242 RepID=A0A2M3ZTD3_9DIPT
MLHHHIAHLYGWRRLVAHLVAASMTLSRHYPCSNFVRRMSAKNEKNSIGTNSELIVVCGGPRLDPD